MKDLIFDLCTLSGVSGSEYSVSGYCADYLKRYTDDVSVDYNNNVIAVLGNINADRTILLDAHLDRIGLIVTQITDDGFLKVAKIGGVDLRTCLDSAVIVHGKEDVKGVICCMPPHLSDGNEDKAPKPESLTIDLGLPAEKVKEFVSLGDTVSFYKQPKELINNRVTATALDNRAGVASLLKVAELLDGKDVSYKVIILLSCQEETYQTGAKTAPFGFDIDECVAVDVSFAAQPEISGMYSNIKLGKGPMLCISPIIDKPMYNRFKELCEQNDINYQVEVCAGRTGTNADCIAIIKSGVRTMLVSVPEKNMHTQAEIVSLDDVLDTAKVISEYIISGGVDYEL